MSRIVIGLTGNFCSGKTQVAEFFKEEGAFIVNADEAGHIVLKNNKKVKQDLVEAFGNEILKNGKIDRAALRQIVFASRSNLEALNSIVHPALVENVAKEIDSIDEGVIILEAAILFELGLNEKSDFTVVIKARKDVSIKRAEKKGLPAKTAEGILNNQISQDKKIELSDFCIDNNGTMEDLKEGVKQLWKEITKSQEVQDRKKK